MSNNNFILLTFVLLFLQLFTCFKYLW